jgi:hypothetical protein
MRVPILTDAFDERSVIGYAEIDETKLPLLPDFHLSLAFTAQKVENDIPVEWKLEQLLVTSDDKFVSLAQFMGETH